MRISETPEFDYMETIWVTRQEIFNPSIDFMLRVIPVDDDTIVQRFFRPQQTTLLHRLIGVECELSFRAIADNYGIEHLQDYLSFYVPPGTDQGQLQQVSLQWYRSYISSPHSEIIFYNENKILTNLLVLNSITNRYFYILFTDKLFLYKFNQVLANIVQNLHVRNYPSHMRKDGRIRRLNLPRWLQKGIYKRDTGHCVHCNKDLTGIWALENAHYDHIVPLADFGTNDPSNFQLLCQDCNLSKGSKRWMPPQDDLLFW